MEEMEHVVTEYHQFDNGDESTIIALFGGFRPSRYRWNDSPKGRLNQKLFCKLKTLGWSVDARCETVSYSKRSCRKSKGIVTNSNFVIVGLSPFSRKEQNPQRFSHIFCHKLEVWNWDLK